MNNRQDRMETIGIAGLGSVGKTLLRTLDCGQLDGFQLAAVSVRDPATTRQWMRESLASPVDCVDFEELAQRCDWVIECAPSRMLAAIARPALRRGRRLVVLSAGALLETPELVDLARSHGGQIIIPTGGLLGLDAVCAAQEGAIHSVTLVTSKPVKALLGAPFLEERGIDITRLQAPQLLFCGSVREVARGFPANVNVGVALALAGIGPDRTQIEVWADPTLTRNTHQIKVESDSASFSMTIGNVTSENPKTARIAALSLIALLRKVHSPLRVGT